MSNLINQAVLALKRGELVAFPTETVYGLGADATNEKAIAEIFKVKQRPSTHPLIVHIASIAQLSDWAREIPHAVFHLAEHYWPGPLTIILKKQSYVSDLVTGGQDTVGIRIPKHPMALELLKAFGGGIAAPSANLFTHVSPTSAEAVQEELGDKISMILDGGACEIGLESTIIDMTGDAPVLLRPGMLSAETLGAMQVDTVKVRAPGQHELHYAPVTMTEYVEVDDWHNRIENLLNTGMRLALLTYETESRNNLHIEKLNNNPHQYAHDLYASLRKLDHLQVDKILLKAVPNNAAWDAIRDRLMKAGGKR